MRALQAYTAVLCAVVAVAVQSETPQQQRAPAADPAYTAFVEAEAAAAVDAQWRFGENYVPQHYGNWQFQDGSWNFGNDKRIQCEACGYTMYMLIDRLGDEFDQKSVSTEVANLCPRVQWVFKSGCEYITQKSKDKIVSMIMRLTEPEDICKQLRYCSSNYFAFGASLGGMMGGGQAPMAGGRMPNAPGMFRGPTPGMPMGGMGGDMFGYGGMGYARGLGGLGMGRGVGSVAGGPEWAYSSMASGASMAHPQADWGASGFGRGSPYSVYPAPGTHPMSAQSPYSPYSFGGYDQFGYPLPHPGVPSSTPPPTGLMPAGGAAAAAAPAGEEAPPA